MKFPNGHFHPILYHEQWINERLLKDKSLKELPTIPKFYANQEILITGGSGFIGKVLIEKLLRSCPDIKTIYILLRPKKGQTAAQRLNSICNQIVFDALRRINPDFMNKIVPIDGDVKELGIGLSEADRKLMKNVSIIFHSAASVRFDDPLKDAVLLNTRGTREILKFAESLKNIKVIMHVSTTYSNVHLNEVREEIYPEIADWRKTIEICEKWNEEELNILTAKYINFMPNTYVFSKNLAEHVSNDYRNKLPLIILRPSIVLNSWEEPFGGYVDNFNGPMGILLASNIGINKTMYGDSKNIMDLTPVDVCVKAMIIAAWKRAHEPINNDLPIINAASANQIKITLQQTIDLGIHGLCEEFPMGKFMVSVPSGGITLCWSYNLLRLFVLQVLPATIIDAGLKFYGEKPRLMRVQRKMYEANKALSFFITHNWNFHNENFLALSSYLKPEDIRAFEFRHYFKASIILYARYILYGYRKYLMNLNDEDIQKDRQKFGKFKNITSLFKICFYFFICYLIFATFDLKC